MITPEMIDYELVDRIQNDLNLTNCYAIKQVLAWLANNPIEPTKEKLKNSHLFHRISWIPSFVEFQRIAYLKKEPEYPQELNNLLKRAELHIPSIANIIQDGILRAYKIGKESK